MVTMCLDLFGEARFRGPSAGRSTACPRLAEGSGVTTSTTMTIAGVLADIQALPAAGVVAPKTAEGFRTAILALQRVLDLGDDTDLAVVDVEELLDRFRAARPPWWSTSTLTTYCSNVRRVLTGVGGGGRRVRSRNLPASGDLAYRVELRPGRFIRFRLPVDLTAAEAGRVARFITALPAPADDESSGVDGGLAPPG
jgi:hypothetical protein